MRGYEIVDFFVMLYKQH